MSAGRIRTRGPNGFVQSILVFGAFLFWLGGDPLPAQAQQQWERVPGAASDIAIGSGRWPDLWMIGATPAEKAPGGYRIFKISSGGGQPTALQGGALRIAMSGDTPWVVTETGTVQRFDGSWRTVAAPKAFDIGASAKGIWIAAEPKVGDDYTIYRWTGSTWDSSKGAGLRLDVDADGNPWVVNNAGHLHAFVGGKWQQFNLPSAASDIAVDISGAPWVATKQGELWQFNKDLKQTNASLRWQKRAQSASAVAQRGGSIWYLGSKNELFRLGQGASATASATPVQVQESPTTAVPAAKTSPLSWIAVSGRNVPGTALIAGKHKSGVNLAVCRADMGDGIHPGKVWGANCVVGWGSREVARPNYEVLSASPDAVKWVAVRNGQSMPANAVVAGKHKSGANLAVCRADMGDGIHPGKVWGARCNVGWGGKEVAKQAFDVLVFAR